MTAYYSSCNDPEGYAVALENRALDEQWAQEQGRPAPRRLESLLLAATARALVRRIPLPRRQRLGARIYDDTALNPLGCTRCSLPFVSGEADDDELCPLCVAETGRDSRGRLCLRTA